MRSAEDDIPADGRVLAVDLGDVRVGLAVSDPGQTIASPDDTLHVGAGDDPEDVADLVAAAARERDAAGIVVGYPRTMEGREGAAAHQARRLAERLRDHDGFAVELWDERLTTVEAERVMLEHDASREERRRMLDRVAAGVILQGWLESRRDSD